MNFHCSIYSFIYILVCLLPFACLFAKERDKEGVELGRWGDRESLGGKGRRATVNKIRCIHFQLK